MMDRKGEQGEKRKQGVFTKGLDSEVAETGTKMDHCTSIKSVRADLNSRTSYKILRILIENGIFALNFII